MRPNLPFLSTASNAILKPGGPLWWKKRLVKDVRLPLPLTEVIEINRLTSPSPDVLRLSSPRPRLSYGWRLALLSLPNLTLNLCTLSPSLYCWLPFLIILSQGIGFGLCRLPEIPLSCLPAKGSFRAEPEVTFPSSAEPRALRSLTRPFATPSPPLNFLWLALIFPPSLPLAQTKLPIPS